MVWPTLGSRMAKERNRTSRGHSTVRKQPWASCLHTCASITKQYNLVRVNQRWCPAAGKVTVGLVSHWPCIRLVVYPPMGSQLKEGRWPHHLHSSSYGTLYLYLYPMHQNHAHWWEWTELLDKLWFYDEPDTKRRLRHMRSKVSTDNLTKTALINEPRWPECCQKVKEMWTNQVNKRQDNEC